MEKGYKEKGYTIQFVDEMCGDVWKKKGCHGPVICNYDDGSEYQGEWQDGKRHGIGTYISPNRTIYEGEWVNGSLSGQGTCTWSDGAKYVGQWKDGKYHGQGKFTITNCNKYEGEWKEGKLNGQGACTYPNGMRYEGELKDDKRHGHGVLISPFGDIYEDIYEGKFENDLAHGEGIYTWGDGVRSEGEFREGDPWNVVGYDENGEICGLINDGKVQEVYTSSHRCANHSQYQEEETKILTKNRR